MNLCYVVVLGLNASGWSAGLKFYAAKCRLFQEEMIFLGYLIDEFVVRPDEEKMESVPT